MPDLNLNRTSVAHPSKESPQESETSLTNQPCLSSIDSERFSELHLIKKFTELEHNRRLGRCYNADIDKVFRSNATALGISGEDASGIVSGLSTQGYWSGLPDLQCLLYALDGNLAGVRVLDLGCGSNQSNGRFGSWRPYMAVALSGLGADVIGVDYRSYEGSNPPYKHIQGDICTSSWITEKLNGLSFDLVIARSLSEGGLVDERFGVHETLNTICRTAKILLTDVSPTPEQFQPIFAWNREEGSNRFYLSKD